MGEITFGQLLYYYHRNDNMTARIQIVSGDQDWDKPDEVTINSEMIWPFADWRVADLDVEKSYADGKPIIRIGIMPVEDENIDWDSCA